MDNAKINHSHHTFPPMIRQPLYMLEQDQVTHWWWPGKCQQCNKWYFWITSFTVYQIPTGLVDPETNKEYTTPFQICIKCAMENCL